MSEEVAIRARALTARTEALRLLGRLPVVRGARGGRAAHDAAILLALRTASPAAVAAWREAERHWWTLAQLGTARIVVAEARRLHVSVAGRYDLDDLTQAGWEGAYRAAQTWDPAGGAGWRTYARAGIRGRIQVQLRIGQTEVVQAPSRLRAQTWRLTRELAALGDRPGALAIAAERAGLTLGEVAALWATRQPMSLDAPLSDDGGVGHDVIPAPAVDPDHGALVRRLGVAIRRLPAAQRTVVIGVLREETYAVIGEELGVSRERVRQLFIEAVRSLRIDLDVGRTIDEPIRRSETVRERVARVLRNRALTVAELTLITGAEWGQVYRAARQVAEVGPGRRWVLRAP